MDTRQTGSMVWLALFAFFLVAGGAEAATLEVGPSGYPYTSIQAAITAASSGDTVLVHDGIYLENINFSGKAITVKSENGAAKTIIDANHSGSGVTFISGEGSGSVLDGFTVTNGYVLGGAGGGIQCSNASPTITNCVIIGNWASYNGGGISCYGNASPTITNCIISGNTSSNGWGGGISCGYSSHPAITNCVISGNTGWRGSAISCDTSSSPTITNCTITGNVGNLGAIYIYAASSPSVKNTILWGNSPSQIYFEPTPPSSITVTNSDVDQDGYAGSNGNIRQNPLFVNPVNKNFRLQPTSPCIDAGTSDGAPPVDLEGNARFDASWVPNTGAGTYPYYDMGALEYVKKPGAWNTFYGSSDYDEGYGIARDGSGNVYITGPSGATWSGPAGESPLHAYTGNRDIFVLKLDGSGAYQWHTFYGSSDYDEGYGIATDGSGNVYITGSGYATWNGPAQQAPLNAYTGNRDIFVLKLDGSGAYQWHTFYGSSGSNYSYGIATHGSGNVYVTGESSATWNGPAQQSPLNPYTGDHDIFVLKLNSSGAYQFHTFYGSSSDDYGYCIATDGSGNVYVTGGSYASWNGPAQQSPLNAYTVNGDILVLKLDSNGSYQWHTFYGSSSDDYGYGFAMDGSGNIYVMGGSYASWNGPANQSPLHSYNGYTSDIFVLKLDSSGSYQWHTFYGSSDYYDAGYGIAMDGSGNVYITGFSSGTWNGPAQQSPLHAYMAAGDIFVLKLDSSGSYQWHTFYGSGDTDYGMGIATDGGGNVYVAGYSNGTWNGPGGRSPLHAYTGNGDIFILKLSRVLSGFDFDRNGLTDVAAFHLDSDQFFTDYAGNMGQYGWGGNDCYPLVWDYDGNGATDVSIYNIPTNQWFVKGYPGDNLGAFGWGADEAVPVPGDYNGDGTVDRAFYHWPTNRWFVEQAGGSFTAYASGWGGADSIPIAADYDGNGTTDMMLYHVPTNQWFVYGIGNLGQFGWNGSECIPVPGDWDGDGRTEIGIYHWPSNQWFWRNEDGTTHFLGQYGWGGPQSFPIPGDYNGDGVMERAFYRPAENRWFVEGRPDFVWGYGGSDFMPISNQMTIYNWFRFGLGKFQ
jgi:parallel beta-helix repeat protein